MTFQAFEDSVSDGQPVELYRFTSPSREYLYTSASFQVDLDGDIFAPEPIRRNALAGTSQEDSPTVEVEMSIANELVLDFAFSIPETSLEMQIIRTHGDLSNTSVIWEGVVTGISVRGRTAKLKIPSRFGEGMAAPLPTVYWQTQCNHVVYNARCGASRAAFEQTTTITTIDSVGTSISVADAGGQPDGWYQSGEIVNNSTGERRLIVENTGNDMKLNFPFRQLSVGDEVVFVAGCDRSVGTCLAKFNNVINFGGHPLIPSLNLFETGLDGASTSITTTTGAS